MHERALVREVPQVRRRQVDPWELALNALFIIYIVELLSRVP